jgi:hypothetical protein
VGVSFRNVAEVGVSFRNVAEVGVSFRNVAEVGVSFRNVAEVGVSFRNVTEVGVSFRNVAEVGVSFASNEGGNRSSFGNTVSSDYLKFLTMDKIHKLRDCVTHNRQNPFDSTYNYPKFPMNIGPVCIDAYDLCLINSLIPLHNFILTKLIFMTSIISFLTNCITLSYIHPLTS